MMNFGGGGGVGGYFNGGSVPPSSNLSALAPPFMVGRSSVQKPNSTPLVDLTEPHFGPPLNSSLPNWLGFESLSVPSSSSYTPRYSPATHTPSMEVYPYGQGPADGTTSSFAEPNRYYSWSVSPKIQSDVPMKVPHQATYEFFPTTDAATLSASSLHDQKPQGLSNFKYVWGPGLWEGYAGWDNGKAKDASATGSSICNFANQGVHASRGLSTFEEASPNYNMFSGEKQHIVAGTDHFDHKSFADQIPKFMPSDFKGAPTLGSDSLFSETCPLEPYQSAVNSMNCQMPQSASHEKCSRLDENNFVDSTAVMKCSTTLGIRMLTSGSKFAALSTGSSKDVNRGDGAAADKDITGISSATPKASHSPSGHKKNIRFDATNLCLHLKQNESISAEQTSNQNKDLSNDRGTSKDAFKKSYHEKCELQVPSVNQHSFNLSLNTPEECKPFQNSSESLDSPCWKGAPVLCFTPCEASEPVSSLELKIPEIHSNFQGPQLWCFDGFNDVVKDSSQKPSESSLFNESSHMGNGALPSPKRPAIGNFFVGEHALDGDMKAGLNHKRTNSDHGSKSAYDIDGSKNNFSLLKRLIDESDFGYSQTVQPSPDAVVVALENKWPSGTSDSDFENKNDEASKCSPSHVSIHAAEHDLCSPSSVQETSDKLIKSDAGKSIPNNYVQTLVNSMHNLSELLLFHCSNGAYKLNEEDCQVLNNVICNLHKCTVNAGHASSTQESIFPLQATNQIFKGFSGHKKAVSDGQTHVTGVEYKKSHLPPSDLFDAEKKHYIESAKEKEQAAEFVPVDGAAEIMKHDQMTQAIKKILAENFHDEEEVQPENMLYKNLWLEAEAALCSVSYMARFNRMKFETEKCKSQKTLEIATHVEKPFRSQYLPDLSMASQAASQLNGGSTSDVHVLNHSGISINGQPDLCKASHPNYIMARLNILKCRGDNSNSGDGTDEKSWSGAEVEVDKLAPEEKCSPVPDDSVKYSTVSKDDGEQDFEASVIARFNILKGRADSSSSENIALQKGLEIEFERKNGPVADNAGEDRFSDLNVEWISQCHGAKNILENATTEEFYVGGKDNPAGQFVGGSSASSSPDSSSSDWEHVRKDELAGHKY